MGRRCRGQSSHGFLVIVRHLMQTNHSLSRRAFLGGLMSAGSALTLGGCAGLGATGARFDASSLSGDPTLLVVTTRKPVNGGRAKPWFGPERATSMRVAQARLVAPDESRLSLASVGLGDWRLDRVEPVSADASDLGLTIHPHPTLSETVGMAAEAFEGTLTDLYIPKKKK